ncbi:response regulator [Candidatus Omnitrophota bacterium]
MMKKILIVDDNAEDIAIIKRFLDEAGFKEVLVAENGEEGVKKAKSEKPNLAIIDTMLPGIDGFETCRRIKEIEEGRIRVVIITGVFDAVNIAKAKKVGADDFTAKTSDCESLVRVIKQFI